MTHAQLEGLLGNTVGSKVQMVLIAGVIYHRLEDGSWVACDDDGVSA